MPGADLCVAKLMIIQARMGSEGKKVLLNWGNNVLGKSQALCPVKTGKLRRAGNVKTEKNTLTEFYIRIGYPTDYAAKVHEIQAYHAVGQWKFLSTPFNAMKNQLMSELESGLKKAL